jgi:hypothetical protein
MGNGWFGVMDGLLPSLRSFQPRPLDGVKRECSSNRFGVRGSEFGRTNVCQKMFKPFRPASGGGARLRRALLDINVLVALLDLDHGVSLKFRERFGL